MFKTDKSSNEFRGAIKTNTKRHSYRQAKMEQIDASTAITLSSFSSTPLSRSKGSRSKEQGARSKEQGVQDPQSPELLLGQFPDRKSSFQLSPVPCSTAL